MALGRTRVRVDFERTKRGVFGRVGTNEPVIDNVHVAMLTVAHPGTECEEAEQ